MPATESKKEQVLKGVLALLTATYAGGDVARNEAKPKAVNANGTVRMRDGDPGDPEIDLSPLTYNFAHRIPLEVAIPPGDDQESALDTLLRPLGVAIRADRTLGGLCQYVDVEMPSTSQLETTGAEAVLWADFAIVASYATNDPLN